MRVLIDLPDPQIQALAALCDRVKQPRAVLIRQAVAEYLARQRKIDAGTAFGLWGAGGEDGLTYQDRLRAEW